MIATKCIITLMDETQHRVIVEFDEESTNQIDALNLFRENNIDTLSSLDVIGQEYTEAMLDLPLFS